VGYTTPFWQAAARKELAVQVDSAGRPQFYPRPVCTSDPLNEPQWRVTSGRGRIVATTWSPKLVSQGICLALIELDEGVRILSNVYNLKRAAPSGQRVRVIWQERPKGPPMFAFEPDPVDEERAE
jgi:uncharacterized OB-fold protein